jgi:hypothetical protein
MSKYGLLRVIPGAELPTNNEAPEGEDQETEVFHSELERHIRQQWEANRNAKLRIEESLLEDLRAKNGEYHPQKLQDIRQMGGSEIYMMITATKQRAAASWIKDIILPEDEKAWGIDPTPVPDLPKWAEDAVQDRVQQMGGNEQQLINLRQMVRTEMDAQAEISSDNMERLMEDQLVEAKWGKIISDLVDDFTTFSAAIMKGPMLKKRKTLKWEQGFGRVKPKIGEEMRVEYERVSPFDIYPSPEADDINDGSLIEHIRFRRGELYNMLGIPGYKDKEIRGVLTEYEAGKRIWLWNDSERNEMENKHHWWRHHREGLIDGLHYWGSIQGKHLRDWGLDIEDELAEYQIDAILIGRYIIRCSINNDPLARRPYQKACYDPIPGGFWGNSIRYLMADIQELCNATARSLVNNMAMASGPQVEVNYERLSPLEHEMEMYPWKIWQTRGSEVGGASTLQFFQPESNAQELMLVYDKFEIKADDATSIPRYSHGNEDVGGAGTTASGLSMLMNSAAKGIKAAIGSFDNGITRPALEQLYYYNMITTKDPGVQGDAKVVARGANALLLRDMAQQRRNEFLAVTNNPVDIDIIGIPGRAELLRGIAKDFEMEGIVPSKEMIEAKVKQAMENPPPDPEIVKIESENQNKEADRQLELQIHQDKMAAEQDQDGSGEAAKLLSDERVKMAQINATKEKDLAKIAADEASKTRTMSEETVRIRQRNRDNLENELEKHAMTLEAQENQARLDRELKEQEIAANAKQAEKESQEGSDESQEGSAAAQPIVMNVVIDSKSGKVKKTIKVNRDASRAMESLDIEEEVVEESGKDA